RVLLAFTVAIALQRILLLVAPEIIRVVAMGMSLIQVSEPEIEPLAVGNAHGIRFAQAPLADHAGRIARLAEHFGDSDIPIPQWNPFATKIRIAADRGVPGVLPRHQAGARRRANRAARVE